MPTEKAHGLQIAHMCNAFAQLGHQVTLVVPRRNNPITEDLFLYYGLKPLFSVKYISSPDLLTRWGKYGRWVHWVHSIFFLIRLIAYTPQSGSIVYTRTSEIAWLFRLRSYTVVCEVHDWPESFAWLYAFFLRRVQLIPCNSPGTERVCRAHGLSQTIVAHNGIDLEEFLKVFDAKEVRADLGLPQEKKIVMYIGALETWKGVATLCEASTALSSDTQVVIIGGNQKQVSDFCAQYPKITFLGTRPYKDLAKNQRAADVLVVPNIPLNEESTDYTSPIKLFAHMASGVPVIVSDLPSLRAIVSDESTFFFKAGDPAELAHCITKVLANTAEAERRAREAGKEVLRYTWQNRAREILSRI